jgi:DNA (cytosine-5)-methyltransferase 1
MVMKVLDLFSGIGGFSLGLERAGMETIAFCEIEKYPCSILKKHWPDVPIFNDVKELHAKDLPCTVDLICGGFPCQDLSLAGHQKGFKGERSSLYSEMLRIISECMPRWAVFENVTALLTGEKGRWFAKFLYDLASIGFDAEWHCIPACFFGACHSRNRVWIIAYPNGANVEGLDIQKAIFAYQKKSCGWEHTRAINAALPADDYSRVRGNYDGVSLGVVKARLKALGNSVVPQIPEIIGRAIMEA